MRYAIYVPHGKTLPVQLYPECDNDRLEELQEFVQQGRGRLIVVGDEDADHDVFKDLSSFDYNGDSQEFEELNRKY